MRYFITIVFVGFVSNLVCAQNHLKAKQFINEIVGEQTTADSIYHIRSFPKNYIYKKSDYIYQDSVGLMAINMMRNGVQTATNNAFYIFRKDSVIYTDNSGKRTMIKKDYTSRNLKTEQIASDSLIITAKEKAYINAEIDKMSQYIWTKDLLPSFTFIPTDTIKKAFSQSQSGGWRFFEGKRRYSFGVPIFLRNDSYCLFYYGYGCGGECGEGYFSIYKKVKGKWMHWLNLSGWMS